LRYEKAIKAGKFIIIVHGSVDDAIHANEILNHTKPEILDHHQGMHLQ
jgi:hypothetical protein